MVRVAGETRLRRGTSEFKPTATEQDAPTARKYDCAIFPYDRGDDLLALALLMATFSDWLATCHAIVPVVFPNVLCQYSQLVCRHGHGWRVRIVPSGQA